MALNPKTRRPNFITVGDFYERHREALGLVLLGSDAGFGRKIGEPTINRPGLALSGFLSYFAYKRVQVLGNSELSYLHSTKRSERETHFREMCERDIPCVVVSRGKTIPEDLMAIAAERGISVFQSPMITMKFVNAATIMLEMDFAPSCSVHGSMVDVQGIGILVRGKSGAGKSETVLGLLGRGGSLVADDVVHLRAFEGRELIGSAPDGARSHMEVRGIGVINVAAMFGIGSIRLRKRLDLIVDLVAAEKLNEVDRFGAASRCEEFLGIPVPVVEIPVAAGRDLARLVEIAGLDQKLKSLGYDAAVEFNKKLLNLLEGRTIY
jgi:HPr kinase/phosphorylase